MEKSTHPIAVKSQGWIVAALLEQMEKKPYKAITVTELCKCAQVDRRTFYRNFKAKDDVLEHYILSLKGEYLAGLKKVKHRTIYTMAEAEFRFWQRHTGFLTSLKANGLLLGVLLQAANSFVPQIYTQFHPHLPPRFAHKVCFLIGGYCNLIDQWIGAGAQESPEELAAIIAEMFDEKNSYWRSYIQGENN